MKNPQLQSSVKRNLTSIVALETSTIESPNSSSRSRNTVKRETFYLLVSLNITG